MYCPLETPPYFHFSIYQRGNVSCCYEVFCILIVWQHLLSTGLLRLNDFLVEPLKEILASMDNMNEKNSNAKVTWRTFPESSNDKLKQPYHKYSYIMSNTSLGKYIKSSLTSKLYKKSKKSIPTRKNFVVVFSSKLSFPAEVLTHMPREVRQEVIFVHFQLGAVQHRKMNLELLVALLMKDEVRDDGKMWVDEQKMRGELWV